MAQALPDGAPLTLASLADYLERYVSLDSYPVNYDLAFVRGAGMGVATRGARISGYVWNSTGDDLGSYFTLPENIDTSKDATLRLEFFSMANGADASGLEIRFMQFVDGVDADASTSEWFQAPALNGAIGNIGVMRAFDVTITAAQLQTLKLPQKVNVNITRVSGVNVAASGISITYHVFPRGV